MTSLFKGPCSGLLTAGGYLDPVTSLRPCPQKCTSQPLSARVLFPGKHKDPPFGAGPRSDGPAPTQLMGSSPILARPSDGCYRMPPSCHLSNHFLSAQTHTEGGSASLPHERSEKQLPLTTSGRNPKSLQVGRLRTGVGVGPFLLPGEQKRYIISPYSRKLFSNSSLLLTEAEGVGMEWEKSWYDTPTTVLLVCVSWLSEIRGYSAPCIPVLRL